MKTRTTKIPAQEVPEKQASEQEHVGQVVEEVGEELAHEELAFRTTRQPKIILPPVKPDDWKAGYRALVGLMTVVGQETFGNQLPGKAKAKPQLDEWPPLAA